MLFACRKAPRVGGKNQFQFRWHYYLSGVWCIHTVGDCFTCTMFVASGIVCSQIQMWWEDPWVMLSSPWQYMYWNYPSTLSVLGCDFGFWLPIRWISLVALFPSGIFATVWSEVNPWICMPLKEFCQMCRLSIWVTNILARTEHWRLMLLLVWTAFNLTHDHWLAHAHLPCLFW